MALLHVYFFKFFVCWWNLKTRPSSDRHIAFIAKQRISHSVRSAENSSALALWCITTFDLLRTLVHLHCDVSQRLICWELSCTYIVMYHNVWFCWELSYTFIVTSWSECQQLKHGDLDDVSRAIRHDYGRKSAPNHHVDVTKSMSVWKGRFKDSRHDYFMMLQLSSSGYSCLQLHPKRVSTLFSCVHTNMQLRRVEQFLSGGVFFAHCVRIFTRT